MARDRAARTRRRFVRGGLTLAGLALLSGCGTMSLPWEQPPKVRQIGYLSPDSPPPPDSPPQHAAVSTFVRGLRDLGYVEGQNIEIAYRWAEGREERLPELAADLVGLPVDVIFAVGAVGGLAAKDATGTIPIVNSSNDPVAAGLVASLARPGGNLTGLTLATPLIGGKRVELLKEAVPSSVRIAVLGYSASTTLERDWDEAQVAALQLGLELARYDVRGADDFAAAFAAMAAAGVDALLILQNRFFLLNRGRLLGLAAQHRLPMMADNRTAVVDGGLMSYGADADDLTRRSAEYVDKILKGAKPGDLPIEQPTKFDLVINLQTAQALGLTIPPSVLQQATEIVQ
jgi:putative tryptophan/tyrosine transport system substrate-binding protein